MNINQNTLTTETDGSTLVRHWLDLSKIPESKTHRLEIDVERGSGWITEKGDKESAGYYLTPHTFYGLSHSHAKSTRALRKCGFNVTIANWDA